MFVAMVTSKTELNHEVKYKVKNKTNISKYYSCAM